MSTSSKGERASKYKKKKRQQFKGRKERLKIKTEALLCEIQEKDKIHEDLVEEKKKENLLLKRRCTALLANCRGHDFKGVVSSAVANSCTRATHLKHLSINNPSKIQRDYMSLKVLADQDVELIEGEKIGNGVFGSCFMGTLGPLPVCAKVFRMACLCESAFRYEAVLLSKLCHTNLPWLYGIIHSPRTIIQSYHSIDGKACTLHKALYRSSGSDQKLSSSNWMAILLGIASAAAYIHSKEILHNDIKSDNVVLCDHGADVKSILIDFGKGCYISDARLYKLTAGEKAVYVRDHPQVAPEVRDGHEKQSIRSDVYAVGRMLFKVNDKILHLPDLSSYSNLCMDDTPSNRPTSLDLFEFLSSL